MQDRKVKIVATLGPASASKEMIRAFAEKGVNVFRLNMSHGTHQTHEQSLRWIRQVEQTLGRPLGVLVDLQGPKLRIGKFESPEGVVLKEGQAFTLDLSEALGTQERVCFPHASLYPSFQSGDAILLNDGALRLEITKVTATVVTTEVIIGGKLSDHKGVNIPDGAFSLPALTKKDRADLDFMLEQDIDFIGLSFVQRPEDLHELREIVGARAAILSKIEKPQALEYLEEIIDLSDGVMVARGDLGVEISPENVPAEQKRIITMCREAGKPVIVATQMLESMIAHPFPTRAEASDVATAAYDGADAVMLSAESAAGAYPLEAIAMMDKIIRSVEHDETYVSGLEKLGDLSGRATADAIAVATRQMSYALPAKAIVTYTAEGGTASQVANKRPGCVILGLTDKVETARRLALVWGVVPHVIEGVETFEEMTEKACEIVALMGGVSGDRFLFTCGVPFGNPGSTNIINVQTLS